MIGGCVKTGFFRANSNGKGLGAPRISLGKESRIVELRSAGMEVLAIGEKLGVGSSTVQQVIGAS